MPFPCCVWFYSVERKNGGNSRTGVTKWGNLGIRAARRISRQARSSEPTIRAGTKIRREFMRQGVLLVVLWLMTSATRSADQVTLQNGDRLTGSIVKSDAKTLLVRTEFAGEVNIKWEAIAAMEASQPLHLVLRDGQTIVGRVTTSAGKLEVATRETGKVEVAKDAVVTVRNEEEEKAYNVEVERLGHPKLTDFWSGSLDSGLSNTRGNSQSLNFSVAGKAARVTDRDKISVYTNAIYAKSTINGVSGATAHDIRGGVRGDVNVSDRLFVFAFTDLEYNAFQHLDLRNVLGGGFGYHAIKRPNTTFDVFGEAASTRNTLRRTIWLLPIPRRRPRQISTPHPAVTRKSGEAVAGEELNAKIGGRTAFTQPVSPYPNLSRPGNYPHRVRH